MQLLLDSSRNCTTFNRIQCIVENSRMNRSALLACSCFAPNTLMAEQSKLSSTAHFWSTDSQNSAILISSSHIWNLGQTSQERMFYKTICDYSYDIPCYSIRKCENITLRHKFESSYYLTKWDFLLSYWIKLFPVILIKVIIRENQMIVWATVGCGAVRLRLSAKQCHMRPKVESGAAGLLYVEYDPMYHIHLVYFLCNGFNNFWPPKMR